MTNLDALHQEAPCWGAGLSDYSLHAGVACKSNQRKKRIKKPKASPTTWVQRMRRVSPIEIESCKKCGGRVRVIA